ncbi:MAG: hypothetical protein ACYDAK_07495 [Candidatus Limnocylindrales bacterium]
MADEEGVAVVVGVEEPRGDVVDGRRAEDAGGRVVDVEAADLDGDLAILRRADVDVGLARPAPP